MTDAGGRAGLSEAALRLPRSGIRAIMERATAPDVIHLEVGEPDFATPAHVVEAAAAAARAGQTKYTSARGAPELREAIAARLVEDRGLAVEADRVMVAPGGGPALLLAYLALLDRGDEVLIPDPGWPNTEAQVLLAGGVPVRYPLRADRGFVPDLDAVEMRLRSGRVRAIYVNSPANPTGAVFDAGTVASLVSLCARVGCWLVSDECYEAIRFGVPLASPLGLGWERTVAAFSLSKTYAMTGWRVGYLVAPPELVAVAGTVAEPVFACASAVSQAAALAALTGPQDCVAAMVAAYRTRRDAVAAMLGQPQSVAGPEPGAGLQPPVGQDAPQPFPRPGLLAAVPEGAFYALVDVRSSGLSSRAFALDLLEHARVATAPGDTFGPAAEGYVRVSLASRDELLAEGVSRLIERLETTAEGGRR